MASQEDRLAKAGRRIATKTFRHAWRKWQHGNTGLGFGDYLLDASREPFCIGHLRGIYCLSLDTIRKQAEAARQDLEKLARTKSEMPLAVTTKTLVKYFFGLPVYTMMWRVQM